jgi:hypothetical protein
MDAGKLTKRKVGGRTIILMDSIKALLASPEAA